MARFAALVAAFALCSGSFSWSEESPSSGFGQCGVPFGPALSLSQLDADLRAARTGVERAIIYKQRFGDQMSIEGLDWSIKHSEWLVAYYQTFNLVLRSAGEATVKENLERLASTIDLGSDLEGYRLLELYQYLGEFSDLAVTINPELYDQLMSRIQDEVQTLRGDPTTNPRIAMNKELRLSLLQVHFGRVLFRPHEVKAAYSRILDLHTDGLRLPPAYLDYLKGYAQMVEGTATGEVASLESSAEAFAQALKIYDLDCNPRMAAKIAYYKMGVHSDAARFARDQDDRHSQIREGLKAGEVARSYSSLLEAPDEWRAIHRRSGELFDMAAQTLPVSHVDRENFIYLAKRSFELATSF